MFDEIKDQIISQLQMLLEKIQENDRYILLRDRFSVLPLGQQKMIVYTGSIIFILMLFLIPYAWVDSSQNFMAGFRDKRFLIRDLIQVQRDIADIPQTPPALSEQDLRGIIDGKIQQINAIPEQLIRVDVGAAPSGLIPGPRVATALTVVLSKLNLRQASDFALQMSQVHPAVKLMSMNWKANREEPKYLDATYGLIVIQVPQFTAPIAQPEEKAPKKSKVKATDE